MNSKKTAQLPGISSKFQQIALLKSTPSTEVTLLKDLSSGEFKVLKKVHFPNLASTHPVWIVLASKIIFQKNDQASSTRKAVTKKEICFLGAMQHRNVIRLLDYSEANQNIFLLFEHASQGDLSQALERNGLIVDESKAVWLILQVCQALKYIHERSSAFLGISV